jgi:hypothetical protein
MNENISEIPGVTCRLPASGFRGSGQGGARTCACKTSRPKTRIKYPQPVLSLRPTLPPHLRPRRYIPHMITQPGSRPQAPCLLMGEALESRHATRLPPGGAARDRRLRCHLRGREGLASQDPHRRRRLRRLVPGSGGDVPFAPGPSLQNVRAGGESQAAPNAVAGGRTARTQVFSPPVLQPGGSWGKPRSGLKGYSSVGRVAVS